MYTVVFGEWGEVWSEYESLEKAQEACEKIADRYGEGV